MFLNIKQLASGFVFLWLIFNSFNIQAQEETEEDPKNDPQEKKEHVLLSFGYLQPIPFGNNVANEAYSISGGFEHSVWAHVSLDIWVGAELSIFGADVERKDLVGVYNDVNMVSIGPQVGYRFYFGSDNDFGLLLGVGVGYVKYKNFYHSYKFYDDGTALWLTGDLDYDLTDHFGLYFSGKIRRDFLDPELLTDRNYFDSNYIMLSIGIRVTI